MFSNNLNRILSELKKSKKISQAQIARQLGVTPSNLNDWAKGRSVPNADKITKLAEVLGVAVSDLIDEPEEKSFVSNSFNNLNNSVAVNGSGSVIINGLPSQQIPKHSETDAQLLALSEDDKKLALDFVKFIHSKKYVPQSQT